MPLAFCPRIPARRAKVFQHVRPAFPPKGQARMPSPVSPRTAAQQRPEPALRMEVEVLDTAESVEVRLRGEAGVPEATALETAMFHLLVRRLAFVTFDLSGLRSVSKPALDALVDFCRAAVRAGTRVGLAPELQPAVRQGLNKAEVLGLFEAVSGPAAGTEGQACIPDGRRPYPNVDAVQRTFKITWYQLVELEPRLETLLGQARRAGASCRTFSDVDRAFGPVRNDLAELIGFAGEHHQHPVLGGVGALEVAYWKLYDAVAGSLAGRAAAAPAAPEK